MMAHRPVGKIYILLQRLRVKLLYKYNTTRKFCSLWIDANASNMPI